MARRILLADDSVTAQNMGRRILTDAGYEVVTVNNGSAALKKIAENKPDLIVLDVYMPGYGGLEVCQRVKDSSETKQIPVLLTVGKLEPFKAEEARRVGADAFIVKPFEATELLTVLTKLEDKIVAQPQQKSGKFAKTLAAIEQSDTRERFGDRETGWKNRLTIPNPNAQPKAEPESPENIAAIRRDPDAAKPVEPPRAFERPIPAGVPRDITPEEIAAITAAAAAFGGKAAPAPAAEVAAPEPAISQEAPPAVPVEPSHVAPAEIAAPAAIAPVEVPRSEEHQIETHRADDRPAEVQQVEGRAFEAGRFQDQRFEYQHDEHQQVEDRRVEEPQAAAHPIESPQIAEPVAEVVAETPAAAVSEEVVTAPEAQISELQSSELQVAQSAQAGGEDEVMAALASLSPAGGHVIGSVSAAVYGSNGSAAASGPRWIAELVELAPEETKLALNLEMDQALAARAAEAVAALAMSSAVASAVSAGELAPVVAAVSTDQISAVEFANATASLPVVETAQSSVPEFVAADSALAESGVGAPAAESSNFEEHVPSAIAKESAYAAAASAGAGTEHVSSVEAVSATTAVPDSHASALVEAVPQRDGELAAAWQNWKQLRESFVNSQPASPAPEAQVEAKVVEAPAVETQSTYEEAASAVSEEAVSEAVEVEELSEAPEESTAIASIVDTMLAELRPKLVAEIAKKMSSEKEKKEKKKKK